MSVVSDQLSIGAIYTRLKNLEASFAAREYQFNCITKEMTEKKYYGEGWGVGGNFHVISSLSHYLLLMCKFLLYSFLTKM